MNPDVSRSLSPEEMCRLLQPVKTLDVSYVHMPFEFAGWVSSEDLPKPNGQQVMASPPARLFERDRRRAYWEGAPGHA